MGENAQSWTVQRLELLYFNHDHKWQLFQQQPSSDNGTRGEAAQKARFRRQIAKLLDSVQSCLEAAGMKGPKQREKVPKLSAKEVWDVLKRNIADPEQKLPQIINNHRTFAANAGLGKSSGIAVENFLNALANEGEYELSSTEHILDLMSVIQLEHKWELPVLFLPEYILSIGDNDPRKREFVGSFLAGEWRRFYIQSLQFESKPCSPGCEHESCRIAGKRIQTVLACPRGAECEWVGSDSRPLDYHKLCFEPSNLHQYKFYSHVVDSAWAALEDKKENPKKAFIVGYPLEVLGRLHILLIHLVPSESNVEDATLTQLFEFWRGIHDAHHLEECRRFVAQQAESIDITAFQWHFASDLLKAASSLAYISPLVGDTLPKTFCKRARDAFLITSATTSGHTWTTNDDGKWMNTDPGDSEECQAVVVNEQVSVTIPPISRGIESLNKMHREYGTHVLQVQWQWALSFAQMPRGSWRAWTENPDAEREEILLEMVARACAVLRSTSRRDWVGALRGMEVESKKGWSLKWIPLLSSNALLSPGEVFALPWNAELAKKLANSIEEDFRTLAADCAVGCVLKHPAYGIGTKPSPDKASKAEGLRRLEFKFPDDSDEREQFLLTKLSGFAEFDINFQTALAKHSTCLQTGCSVDASMFVSVGLNEASFTFTRFKKWGELGSKCGVYAGDIALINKIINENRHHGDGNVSWKGWFASARSGNGQKRNPHASPAVFEWSSSVDPQKANLVEAWISNQKKLFTDACQKEWQLLDTDDLSDIVKIVLFRYQGVVALWNCCAGISVSLDNEGKPCFDDLTAGPSGKFVVCCAIGTAVKSVCFNVNEASSDTSRSGNTTKA